MKIVKIPLSKLKHPEKNPRIHSEKQIREFVKSLNENEQIRPIVVDENNVILCGNGLYEALRARGDKDAYCLIKAGLSQNAKTKLMLSDNKIYSLGVDDMDVFEEMIRDLGDDLDIPGYERELLETLTAQVADIDDMMAGYGLISTDTKERIESTAQKYEKNDKEFAKEAEEIKPSAEPTTGAEQPEKLERRYIMCPKCGERIWV